MARRAVLLAGLALAGGLYGFATSSIPSPHGTSTFWVGNLCAPWLVLAFFAGRAQGSWRWAAAAGLVIDVACVGGFYARFLTLDPVELGLPASTSLAQTASVSLDHWLTFIRFWVAAAVAGGAVYGVLGYVWGRGRPLAAGLALAAPFLAEPVLWPLYNGHYQGPWAIWGAEILLGLAVARRIAVTRGRAAAP